MKTCPPSALFTPLILMTCNKLKCRMESSSQSGPCGRERSNYIGRYWGLHPPLIPLDLEQYLIGFY